jgi:surfactin synthase thioesterase subunit
MINKKTVQCYKKRNSPKLRLFCFPYAGGNAAYYADWSKKFDDSIEVCAIQLPGHGNRMGEDFVTDIKELIDDIFENIEESLDIPFAFFGHSMGGLLSYLISLKIEKETGKTPVVVVESGIVSPDKLNENDDFHGISDECFIDRLREYGATSEEVLSYPEFYEIFLPIIKSDFELLHSYQFECYEKMKCPIMLFSGREDRFNTANLKENWTNFTNCDVIFYEYEGTHFFINNYKNEILEKINNYIVSRI